MVSEDSTSSDGLASEGLDEDLHASPEPEHQVEGGLLLDVVVCKSATILELLSSKDEPLLIRGDAFLVLDLSLDIVNGVRGLNLEGDGLASEGLNEDLHLQTLKNIRVSHHKQYCQEHRILLHGN